MGLYASLNKFLTQATREKIIREENKLRDLLISKYYDEIDEATNICNRCNKERNEENCKACIKTQEELIKIKVSYIAEIKKFFDILPSDPYTFR